MTTPSRGSIFVGEYTSPAHSGIRLYNFIVFGITLAQRGALQYTLQMHRKAAALGRDHLKLPREDESAANIVAVTGVLERWNQEAKYAAGKVKGNFADRVLRFSFSLNGTTRTRSGNVGAVLSIT